MKLRMALSVAVLPLAFAVFGADEPPLRLRVGIDPGTRLYPVADDFIGFGYEKSAVAVPGLFRATNSVLVRLYTNLTQHGLVRIGGNVSDHTRFIPGGNALVRTEQETTVLNRAVIDEFASFLRATGWKAMWGLNLGTGTKEEAAQEALAVQQALGERLHSFEIGNEVDLLRRFKGYEAYYAAYREYKAAIRELVPGAPFSGPDVAGNTQWLTEFAKTEQKDLKLLTHHYYRTGAKRPEATIETLLGPHAGWQSTVAKLEQCAEATGVPFRLNEVNSFYGGGKPGVSDTFASALWCLDYMFNLAAHGCNGVNMETDVNQLGFISHYSPIFREASGQLRARPEYYGMLAFAVAGTGTVLKTTTTDDAGQVTAYAVRNSQGDIWATLLNKAVSREAQVDLVLPPGCSAAKVHRLQAASAASLNHVTLAGDEISPEGAWSPRPGEALTITSGVVTLHLPPASAAIAELR